MPRAAVFFARSFGFSTCSEGGLTAIRVGLHKKEHIFMQRIIWKTPSLQLVAAP